MAAVVVAVLVVFALGKIAVACTDLVAAGDQHWAGKEGEVEAAGIGSGLSLAAAGWEPAWEDLR